MVAGQYKALMAIGQYKDHHMVIGQYKDLMVIV